MRNIHFSSRETDYKVAIVVLCTSSVAFVGFISTFWCDPLVSIIAPVLSFALAIFAWGVFNIIEPPFYGRFWARSKSVGIPALWLLLFFSFICLFEHIVGQSEVVKECQWPAVL